MPLTYNRSIMNSGRSPHLSPGRQMSPRFLLRRKTHGRSDIDSFNIYFYHTIFNSCNAIYTHIECQSINTQKISNRRSIILRKNNQLKEELLWNLNVSVVYSRMAKNLKMVNSQQNSGTQISHKYVNILVILHLIT